MSTEGNNNARPIHQFLGGKGMPGAPGTADVLVEELTDAQIGNGNAIGESNINTRTKEIDDEFAQYRKEKAEGLR